MDYEAFSNTIEEILDEVYAESRERLEPVDEVNEDYQRGFENAVDWATSLVSEKFEDYFAHEQAGNY